MSQIHSVRLILGDQLNLQHPWFQAVDPGVRYLMMEVRSETDYATHHIQKVVAFFAAMRAFAAALQAQGHQVHYLNLDQAGNLHSFSGNVLAFFAQLAQEQQALPLTFAWQHPDEYRVDQELLQLAATLQQTYPDLKCQNVDSHHFIAPREGLATFFKGKKTYVMEAFYRHQRRQHNLLMEHGEPLGGRWNFDADNRKGFDPRIPVPPPYVLTHDVQPLVKMIQKAGIKTIGTIDTQRFIWPISREEALAMLADFVQRLLPFFGQYQDAISHQHWSLFHSRLSFALNVKLLHPMEVIQAAIGSLDTTSRRPLAGDKPDLAQVEGFVRQILGWREYMRGVYWAKMPDFAALNYFGHDRPLPAWYWTGETHMRCLRGAITQSLTHAYAHHIQRLMVTGNFALLAGIAPDEVDAWYLGIYIDALEWVEITNTRGMSQYADGGLVGTKPYVSSAAYLHKMGDTCKGCAYDPKKRHGPGACPFNSLYWHFHHRHQAKLQGNPRMGYVYPTWHKTRPHEQEALLAQAERYLADIEQL